MQRKLGLLLVVVFCVLQAGGIVECRAAEPVRGAAAVERFGPMVQAEAAEGLARAVVEGYDGPDGAALIEGLGIALALHPETAEAVLDAIKATGMRDEALVRAHLLQEIAIGPADTTARRYGRGSYRTKNKKAQHCLVDPLARRAGDLLDHEDPFVRALAEWAIHIRVANDNENTRRTDGPHEWPKENPPEWFARWYSFGPSDYLELDYARQGIDSDCHRTGSDLLRSARQIARRSAGPTADLTDDAAVVDAHEELNRMLADLKAHAEAHPDDLTGQRRRWLKARHAARKLVLLNPAVDFSQIICVARQSANKHLVPASSRASDHGPGGDIYVQDGLSPDAPARALIGDQLDQGHVQDMDLHWDSDKVVFAYSEQSRWTDRNARGFIDGVMWDAGSEPTHLFEINVDGTGLRQLTDHARFCDMEPAYLPDGHIVFASGRSMGSTHCASWLNGHLRYYCPPNLYRIDPATRDIRRISYNKDEDRYPHVTNDGRIIYMRWDYQERGFGKTQPLWIINPDGTMNDGFYKTHTDLPRTIRDPRPVIGAPHIVAIGCGHHEHIEGAVALIDPDAGRNGYDVMRYVTPNCSPTENGFGPHATVPEGGVQDHFGMYTTPFGLSEDSFLAGYAYRAPGSTAFATYYIDVWGNKELIRRDPIYDVVVPIPLKTRKTPPVIPSQVDPDKNYALAYVSDVYNDLKGVERGEVKYIRILERLQWFDEEKGVHTGIQWGLHGYQQFGYWTEGATRIVGTVPVEEDGSAYFKVPTNMAVWFQALDEQKREVRRMRTHVEFQPGEFRGCIGCHETKPIAAPETKHLVSQALRDQPAMPVAPPWGDTETMDYESMIQPIFEAHCVKCHGRDEPKGGLNLTADRDAYGYIQSYRSLFGIAPDEPTPTAAGGVTIDGIRLERQRDAERKFFVGGGLHRSDHFMPEGARVCLSMWQAGTEITQPRQFGSYRSPLIQKLIEHDAHVKIRRKLTADEWETLVTWVDVNAPYFGTHLRYAGRSKEKGHILESVDVRLDPPFKRGEKGFEIIEIED